MGLVAVATKVSTPPAVLVYHLATRVDVLPALVFAQTDRPQIPLPMVLLPGSPAALVYASIKVSVPPLDETLSSVSAVAVMAVRLST
jgi:hypothetical protein